MDVTLDFSKARAALLRIDKYLLLTARQARQARILLRAAAHNMAVIFSWSK